MPKPQTPDQSTPATDPLMERWKGIAEVQTEGLKALTGMNTVWLEALNEMGSEVMTFVSDRIKEDVKTQHRLLHCKSPVELQAIQAEFLQDTIEQYQAETGKLINMSHKLFAAASTPTKSKS